MTKKATNQVQEGINNAVELTQKSAKLMLKGAVQTAEVAEGYVQGMYKAGYDTNVDALKVAKNYWDAMTEIRQDWLKLFADNGEKAINTVANMEVPFQKQATEFVGNIFETAQKTVENITSQAKTATK